jgi:NAD(P) transhydrogenase subunit alpha
VRIGVTRETKPGETRVAATPATVKQLIGLGYEVLVEHPTPISPGVAPH